MLIPMSWPTCQGLALRHHLHGRLRASAASPATPSAISCSSTSASRSSSSTATATQFEDTGRPVNEWGLWILIAKGWTPFPYKVVTIAARRLQDEPGSVHPGQHRRARPCASIWWRRCSIGSASRSATSSSGASAWSPPPSWSLSSAASSPIKYRVLSALWPAPMLLRTHQTRCNRRPTAPARWCCSPPPR